MCEVSRRRGIACGAWECALKRVQSGYVASAFIEAFPLAADLATRSEILMDVSKMPAPDDDAVDRARDLPRAPMRSWLSSNAPPRCGPKLRAVIVVGAGNSRDVKAST